MRQMKTRFALALVFTLALALGGSALAAGPENKGAEKRKDDDRAGVSKKGPADDRVPDRDDERGRGGTNGDGHGDRVTSGGSGRDSAGEGHEPVTLCHATHSDRNPYVLITVDDDGAFRGHLGGGHQDGEDIIPPFEFDGVTYSQNWDADGQAILAAGCDVPAGGGTGSEVDVEPGERRDEPELESGAGGLAEGVTGKDTGTPGDVNGSAGDEARTPGQEIDRVAEEPGLVRNDAELEEPPVALAEGATGKTVEAAGGESGPAGDQAAGLGGRPGAGATSGGGDASGKTGAPAGDALATSAEANGDTTAPRARGREGIGVGEAVGAVTKLVSGELPLTGLPIWVVLVTAFALAGTGISLRRRS